MHTSAIPTARASHARAILQAIFVTLLWSTSWVLIKTGLADIPALRFAGLRYTLAWACLLPLLLRGERLACLRALPRPAWTRLVILGVVYYALTQGAQFVGLAYLPAITVTLLLGVPLLGGGLAAQGLPPLGLQHWGIIAWLALVNTALAFTLWNHTLRTLTAVESSIINNTISYN